MEQKLFNLSFFIPAGSPHPKNVGHGTFRTTQISAAPDVGAVELRREFIHKSTGPTTMTRYYS